MANKETPMNEWLNLARHLLAQRAALVGIASLLLLGLAPSVRAGSAMEHEAVLQPGEKLPLAGLRAPRTYRVCIPEMPGDVRLDVIHDGEVSEVLDGTCETFTARKMDVTVASKLPAGDALGMKISTVKG